jgi:hypothetical protein
MVPKVAIKGTILPFVTNKPLMQPINTPKANARNIDRKIPNDCVPITIAADIAITDPTEISIPPEIKTIAWPITIGVSIDICLEIFVRVNKLKKDDPNIKVKKVIVKKNKNKGVFFRNNLVSNNIEFMI